MAYTRTLKYTCEELPLENKSFDKGEDCEEEQKAINEQHMGNPIEHPHILKMTRYLLLAQY